MDLLVELMSEEIPARMQIRAAEDLRRLMTEALVEGGLPYAAAASFATPRRLTLVVEGLPKATRPVREERKGPRADAPEAAIQGFLRSAGVAREALETRPDKKGDVLFAVIDRPGRPAAEVVSEALEGVVRGFPWPKSMRWGAGNLRWVRPLQSILCLLSDETGSEIVPLELDGLRAGRRTAGHRFMAPGGFEVSGFEDYRAKLLAAKVVLDPEERVERIRHDAEQMAFARGLEIAPDEGLLREIAGLVEWPVALMGAIPERFLGLPPEVLRTSMKEHQKFLSAREPSGRITHFVTVANRETADGGATVLGGNLRVLSARLSDAAFFWERDLATPMEAMAAKLDAVTFHNRLGSQGDRIRRIAALSREIAPLVGAEPELAERAARLAKADLASAMVYEFPELQGVMGGHYARAAGEPEAVAAACAGHYAPLGPGDPAPSEPVTVAVALADKLDMLAGFWAIGETPTGSKDPFALRRAALGVIRIVLENGLRLELNPLLRKALEAHRPAAGTDEVETKTHAEIARKLGVDAHIMSRGFDVTEKRQDLLAFMAERIKVHLRAEGGRHDVIDACFNLGGQDDLVRLVSRVRALQSFLDSEDGANLLTGYRRAVNIVTAEERKDGGIEYSLAPDPRLAEPGPERELFAALDAAEPAMDAALAREDFAGAMAALARLRGPVDAFFDKVTVNADSAILRRNRLCLLNRVREATRRVADLSAVEG